jgi:hypothetical protein
MTISSAYNILPYNPSGQIIPFSSGSEEGYESRKAETFDKNLLQGKKLKYYVKTHEGETVYTKDLLTRSFYDDSKGTIINIFI